MSEESVKQQVLERLGQFNIDESVIADEAFRSRFSELETLQAMLESLEALRDKLLRRITEYREGFATRLRASADGIMNAGRNDWFASNRHSNVREFNSLMLIGMEELVCA